MIEKGISYGGVKNTTMVTFGSGDIRIKALKEAKYNFNIYL